MPILDLRILGPQQTCHIQNTGKLKPGKKSRVPSHMYMPMTTYLIFLCLEILIDKMNIQREKFIFNLWEVTKGNRNKL